MNRAYASAARDDTVRGDVSRNRHGAYVDVVFLCEVRDCRFSLCSGADTEPCNQRLDRAAGHKVHLTASMSTDCDCR